ncbi:hypothetical protein BC831DRAFT_469343 [Entophlyctis helioformis]|nr:hypothetical protein BC831DRAFT_469343 [Entophlyctis helioformis]
MSATTGASAPGKLLARIARASLLGIFGGGSGSNGNGGSGSSGGNRNRRLLLMFVWLVVLAVLLMGLSSDPEIPYKAAEVYMSCLAPRLSSFNSLLNIENQPCSDDAVVASIDTKLLYEHPDEFARRASAAAAGGDGTAVAGRCKGFWETAANATSSTSDARLKDCLEWVTFSTKCSKNLNRLTAMVKYTGIPFTILGMHTSWQGFGGRIHALAQYLKTVPDDRIVIFTDGDDVLPLPTCSASAIAATFLAQDTPILFMAERECWPDEFLKPEFPKPDGRPSPFLYLNGGSYAGYAWALRDVIAQAFTINCSDDQRGFTRVFLSEMSYEVDGEGRRRMYAAANKGRDLYGDRQQQLPIEMRLDPVSSSSSASSGSSASAASAGRPGGRKYIKLDWHTTLFQSLVKSRLEELDFSRYNTTGRVEQLLTKNEPCIFHQNGDKHAPVMVLPLMIEMLGFDRLWRQPVVPGSMGKANATAAAVDETAAAVGGTDGRRRDRVSDKHH